MIYGIITAEGASHMLHEETAKKREQISLVCIDELVPQNHLLRKVDRVIDWSFICDLVKEKYSPDLGRTSIDPAILIKIVIEDRIAHGKNPLKDKDDDDPSGETDSRPEKERKVSRTDPDSGWFHKGKHQQVFAYSIETACDKHGWVLGFTVNPGNAHDSRTFKGIYDKIKNPAMETVIADAGYKTPGIAKLLPDDGVQPLFPYKRPIQ